MRAAALVTVLALLAAPAAAAPHARGGKGCKPRTSSAAPVIASATPVVPAHNTNTTGDNDHSSSSVSTDASSTETTASATEASSSGTEAASSGTSTETGSTPAPTGSGDFPPNAGEFPDPTQAQIDEVLKAHNDERAKYGASPLTWSADAAAAAKQNVQTCKFAHTSTSGQGQNLAAGTDTSMTIADYIKMWNDEEKDYNWDTMEGAGHWTQVVWKATTQVGCAWTTCSSLQFPDSGESWTNGIDFTCNYTPAGNMVETDGKPGATYKANVGPAV